MTGANQRVFKLSIVISLIPSQVLVMKGLAGKGEWLCLIRMQDAPQASMEMILDDNDEGVCEFCNS